MKTRINQLLTFSLLLISTLAYTQSEVNQEVRESSGIHSSDVFNTSLSEIFIDGIKYLNIQLTNLSTEEQLISWSLFKGTDLVLRDITNKIAPNTTIEILDASMLIPIELNEDLKDFIISVTN